MKLALLSDLHANLRALRACTDHARGQGADRFALLGDLVGYGPEPAELVDEVMALAAAGAIVLGGNHDALAVSPPQQATTHDEASAGWTHARLRPEHIAFLAGLPLTTRLRDALLVHASADQPAAWHYVDSAQRAAACLAAAADATYVFCGHVHRQQLYYQGSGRGLMLFEPTPGVAIPLGRHRRWVATVGSVGQPRDGDPRAMYALWDDSAARLAFHRVPYDHAAAAAALRQAGVPGPGATRLEEGR